MNSTLFKSNIKSNWTLFIFVAGMLLIYVSTSMAMFDPDSAAAMNAMFEILPEAMLKAFGFNDLGTNLTSYMAGYLYGFILLVFPMIYTVMLAHKLVAKHVDSGSMAYLLTTPNTRVKIIMTQALYMIISIFALMIFELLMIITFAQLMFPGLLDIAKISMLTLVTTFVLVFVGGISFLFSCIFNDSKYSIGLGAGIPIFMFMMKMVSELSEKLDYLRFFTIYSVVVPDKILSDAPYSITLSIVLILASIILYGSGIYIFNKKSLAI